MLVDYIESGNSPVVHQWHRDENGNRHHETHTDFEPYFFISINDTTDPHRFEQVERVEEGDWISIQGEPLKKVVVNIPGDVGGYDGIRDNFEETWESNVYFRSRYWLDELEPSDRSPEYRILSFDIESEHSLDTANAPKPIISITAHDSFKDKYITFVLNPDGREVVNERGEDWSIYSYDEEREMLLSFIDFIQNVDPDIVTAWNLDGYDGPYLVNRMRNLRIDYSEISPIRRVSISDDYKEIQTVKGREFIDLIPAFQKVYFDDLDSWRLNNVGAELLGLEKVKFSTGISDLWRDNPEKLIEYNKRDVEIMVQLDEHFRIWDMLTEIQRFVGINLTDCIHPTRMGQAYFMRQTERRMPGKTWVPEEDREKKQKYEGANVLEETPGINDNVAVLDLASQYPSSMISYNMSPEKKVESPEVTDAPTITVGNGVTFEYDELGFIPRILIELIQRRNKEKERRDRYDPDSEEYEQHDITQGALKVIANAIYGIMGSIYFVLYDKDIAASTTYVGRETMGWAVEKAEEMGYPAVYGDTDSIMLEIGKDIDEEVAVDKAEKLGDHINETYDEYAEEKGVDTSKFDGVERQHFFDIETEKFYKRFFMQEAQKKYAGKLKWKEGKWVEDWDFAQYGKKSDMAKISQDVQVTYLKKRLEGATKKELQEYITQVCNDIKSGDIPLDEIGVPSKMKKARTEYKTDRPILRATKFTNEWLEEEFGKGDKPKYVYVKHTPPGMPDTDVVAFSEMDLPDGFKVDYDIMIRKTVRDKIRRINAVLDIEWRELYRTSSSLLEV